MGRKKKQPSEKKRLTDQQLAIFGELFPGFDTWYRTNYDENGNLLPSSQMPAIPGLLPPHLREMPQQEDEEQP